MKLSDIEIGYELEFGSNLDERNISHSLKQIFKNGDGRCKKRWVVKSDGSIQTKHYSEIEIASAVFPLKRGIKNLGLMFEFMDMIQAETNHSTGLHINMGFNDLDVSKALDPIKVSLLTDEEKWLKEFRRFRNDTCTPVRKTIAELHKEDPRAPIEQALSRFKNYHRGKYDSINTTKLRKMGFVEFRIMGNKNYHRRFADVVEGIEHFAASLLDTANGKRDKEFRAELDKLQVSTAKRKKAPNTREIFALGARIPLTRALDLETRPSFTTTSSTYMEF